MSTQTTNELPTKRIWAEQALTASGWMNRATVQVAADGTIASIVPATASQPGDTCVDILLPGIANLHSHSFQRAMAGLTEHRGDQGQDSFWTWRDLMYRFVHQLHPDDLQVIAAYVCLESVLAGYTAIGEFHYLHHQPDGQAYNNLAETSERIALGAAQTGIGLTLLPVLYEQAGCDGRPIQAAQSRFFNPLDRFLSLWQSAGQIAGGLHSDYVVGVAPHSLRAVSPTSLSAIATQNPTGPIHLHIAEQQAEIDEVQAHFNARPVQWLLDNAPVDQHWCLVHATHMTSDETRRLAAAAAVAGLCPVTEANLGDGVFNGVQYLNAQGSFGIGTDSNVRISLVEELRQLEYSQRLRDQSRAALASPSASTGRRLYSLAAQGGARACARDAGVIAPGYLADMIALDGKGIALAGLTADTILDSFIFAGDDSLVSHVWCAGRHVVKDGHHEQADRITKHFQALITRLRTQL